MVALVNSMVEGVSKAQKTAIFISKT